MAKVSILMNCYNCGRFLEETIRSVYAQTFTDWEIIFIDNCSTDNSKDIVSMFDDKIKLYQTPNFMTLGEARTYGLEFCNREYLAFLDTDDLWYPTLLEDSIAILDDNTNDYSMTYSNIEFIDEESNFDKVLFKTNMPSGDIFADLIRGYFITIASVVVKRDCVKDVGDRFNPEYQLIADLELFTDIAYKYKIAYTDKILAKVRKHANSLTSNKFVRFPIETQIYIQHLRERIDDFDNIYKNELAHLDTTMQYQYALADWMAGQNSTAKEKIKKILPKRRKYYIVYLFMNFSYRFFEKCMKLLKIGNY
jgi:glycosyltransferase involved in cell wall biosynthesis